MSESEINDISI